MRRVRDVSLGGALVGGLVGGLASVLIPLGAAFACTPSAELKLATTVAYPGSQIAGTGTGFPADGPPVAIHFDSSTGPVLAKSFPGADGKFTFKVTVPDTAPGQHLIVAVQPEPATGQARPVSAVFDVVAPPTTTTQPPPTTSSTTSSTTTPQPSIAMASQASGVEGVTETEQPEQASPQSPEPPAGGAPARPAAGGSPTPKAAVGDGSRTTGAPSAPATRTGGNASATATSAPSTPVAGAPATTAPPASPTTAASEASPAATAEPAGAPAGGAHPSTLSARNAGAEERSGGNRGPVLVGLALMACVVGSAVGVRRFRSGRAG